ncbi:MAG TPA: enoyl-CoA hydratase/isomerase family protein [Pyrinomonadaceae bacterium]|nr:enoyl-CoA hydratase/isomerase family protein [Pyrinomonadaceae bacterium]
MQVIGEKSDSLAPLQVKDLASAIVITFDRPESRSPLSLTVLGQIEEIIVKLVESNDQRRLIFTGKERVFASGADLTEIAGLAAFNAADFSRRGQGLMSLISAHPVPTIAAINGVCYGGALDLAIACQRRIAGPNAKFCHPGAGLGIMTGWGGTQRLPRLIGQANALEMFMTAMPIGPSDALRIGLVDVVADDPLAEALNF